MNIREIRSSGPPGVEYKREMSSQEVSPFRGISDDNCRRQPREQAAQPMLLPINSPIIAEFEHEFRATLVQRSRARLVRIKSSKIDSSRARDFPRRGADTADHRSDLDDNAITSAMRASS